MYDFYKLSSKYLELYLEFTDDDSSYNIFYELLRLWSWWHHNIFYQKCQNILTETNGNNNDNSNGNNNDNG